MSIGKIRELPRKMLRYIMRAKIMMPRQGAK